MPKSVANIMGSKSELLRTLVAASSAKTEGFGVPSFVPKWLLTFASVADGRTIEASTLLTLSFTTLFLGQFLGRAFRGVG